jgi:YegS/Rv2252/BmrU family lipid kinase
MSQPFFFIVNPRAGPGLRRFHAVAAQLRKAGAPFSSAATVSRGDAAVLARLASQRDFRAIVCFGGDGTANEIVNGLATTDGGVDRTTALGIIPNGTATDFARGLGIPSSREAAVEHLLAGEESDIDVGRIRFDDGREQLFVNVLGAGFDAEVAGRARDVRGAISSIPAHVVGFASVLAVYQNKHVAITLGGSHDGPVRFRANVVVVANGPSYAGMLRLAPTAQFDDGLLDVVVIGDLDRIELLVNLPRVLAGTHLGHEKVTVFRVPSLALESDEHALVQADGDVVGHLPAQVDVLPRALRVIR